VENFSSEAELDAHIRSAHPRDQFAADDDQAEEGDVEDSLVPTEAAAVAIPVFGKPLPAAASSSLSAEPVGRNAVDRLSKRTVSDSEPEDGELHEANSYDQARRRNRKKETPPRSSSSTFSTPGTSNRKRKPSQTSEDGSSRRRKKRSSCNESSPTTSDEDEIDDGLSSSSSKTAGRKRRKKSSRKKWRKSRSVSSPEVKKENDNKSSSSRKGKKKVSLKSLSFEKIVKKMTPKELKSYLREFKKTPDESPQAKSPQPPVEDNDKYSSSPFGEKKAYYYCLICTEHVGSQRKWNKHRTQATHVDRMEETAREARRKYNYPEIDLQECVVSGTAFEGSPCAQCRDCYHIFYTGEELAGHMSRGVCKMSATDARSSFEPTATSSSSLRSRKEIIGKGGSSAARSAAAPQQLAENPAAAAASMGQHKDFPKYLLNGKLAYYFCLTCNTAVGTLIDWHRHLDSAPHQASQRQQHGGSSVPARPEFQLLAHLRRDNAEHRCIVCQTTCVSGEDLWRHFDRPAHQAEEKARVERDWNLMRLIGDRYLNLVHW
jgi:hypothetical protein